MNKIRGIENQDKEKTTALASRHFGHCLFIDIRD
jgi:hypothetical protein